MRLVSWNVNGLRAAIRKGFDRWLREIDPDVVMLQEIRCTPDQLPKDWSPPLPIARWHPAAKAGWSGVTTWSRRPMEVVGVGLDGLDPEGRVLRARVDGIQLVNVYVPSGSAGPDKQALKEVFMARFLPWAADLARQSEPVVLVGDLNVAHTERDVANPVRASKISGFLPHERQWFGDLLATGWTDCVRAHFGDVQGPYSWWSNFGRARELDRGWRIDHVLANAAAAERFRSASIHREAGLCCSDHAPIIADFAD